MKIDSFSLDKLVDAANSTSTVSGFTHDFYNYPARFSPLFVREAVKLFSEPGDLILDPFMGGGTTLVEAKVLKRASIGFDISSLAYFISKVKTTALSKSDISKILEWAYATVPNLKCNGDYVRPLSWIDAGYHKNLSEASIWPLKILMEKYLFELESLPYQNKIKNFLRAALLKSGQWALDSKTHVPSAEQFRRKLMENISNMVSAIASLKQYAGVKAVCQNQRAEIIHLNKQLKKLGKPKLVLTSPPYPGVHVMYHRWQIKGRRETPAPFWIANSRDGHGLSHYTMGDRHQPGLKAYFDNIFKAFSSIAKVCSEKTVVIQVIAFSDPSWQLPKYLETMESAGFIEADILDSRLWRKVPNRKWYAQQKGITHSSNELVLFHTLK